MYLPKENKEGISHDRIYNDGKVTDKAVYIWWHISPARFLPNLPSLCLGMTESRDEVD